MTGDKRLLTRCDFDGLVCATLLKSIRLIDEVRFVHPKDVQDGRISVTESDITANLPFADGVYLAFDHHDSEADRLDPPPNFIAPTGAPSAARVIYDYFGGKDRFTSVSDDLMTAVDRADSADYTPDMVKNPTGWVLFAFLTDPRTGLGRFKNFRLSFYDFMSKMIDLLPTKTIGEIMADPDVAERASLYLGHREKFEEQLRRCSTVHGRIVHVNYRDEPMIFAGNRFMVYAVFPDADISIHEIWGKNKRNVVFAVGKSVFGKKSKINIGELMLQYGGGGHADAGTCQVPTAQADQIRMEILTVLQQLA